MNNCIICNEPAHIEPIDHENGLDILCPNCGKYEITNAVICNLNEGRKAYLKELLEVADNGAGYYYIYQGNKRTLHHEWVDHLKHNGLKA